MIHCMKKSARNLAVSGGVLSLVFLSVSANAAEQTEIRSFLSTHCIECHGPGTQEAQIRLDELQFPAQENDTTHIWARVVDAVERGEMPPAYQTQPKDAEKQKVIAGIIETVTESIRQPIALRRLNRLEYENTVHDLLGVDVPLADLLPEDGLVQGFDKGADGLSFSSVLMEQYLEAANVAFDAAIRRYPPLPAITRRADIMSIRENIESVEKKRAGIIEVDESLVKFTAAFPPVWVDPACPPEDGTYRCRVAVWPYQPGKRSLSVAIYIGSLFGNHNLDFVGVFDATGTSKKPRIIEFTRKMSSRDTIHVVPRIWPEHVRWRDTHEKPPGIGISWVETFGPLDQEFPSEATKKLFGEGESIHLKPERPIWVRDRPGLRFHVVESTQPEQDIERILKDFIPKAFRRPVPQAEMQPFIDLALKQFSGDQTFEQSVRAGITSVLCSPQFLLLNIGPSVDNYDIASRMSYFFWSTLPDKELLELAVEGKLRDPSVRRKQAIRMINDPKTDIFVKDFTGQWLDLSEIESTTPDQTLFPEFDPLLQHAMLGETHQFFARVLYDDLSVMNFVDSDWTFLNHRLASHYNLPSVGGNEQFQFTKLPSGSLRGGVLTQASVMKVTANGTATSPVTRGVWVADKLLGRPAPPPPPGVPAVEPDIRGATTIRRQLEKHRSNADCASCHKRIDPAGFALEEFDPIGGHRKRYRVAVDRRKSARDLTYKMGPIVESAYELPDGRVFKNFQQFRDRLVESKSFVTRAIAEKLLIYATGRRIGISQREVVDEIVSKSAKNDYGLKSMILAMIESDFFIAD